VTKGGIRAVLDGERKRVIRTKQFWIGLVTGIVLGYGLTIVGLMIAIRNLG
jgi:hypothetical protein